MQQGETAGGGAGRGVARPVRVAGAGRREDADARGRTVRRGGLLARPALLHLGRREGGGASEGRPRRSSGCSGPTWPRGLARAGVAYRSEAKRPTTARSRSGSKLETGIARADGIARLEDGRRRSLLTAMKEAEGPRGAGRAGNRPLGVAQSRGTGQRETWAWEAGRAARVRRKLGRRSGSPRSS